MEAHKSVPAARSFFPVMAVFLTLVSCDLNPSNWSQVCVRPFVLHFPLHVAGTYSGSSNGRYGLPEAVEGVYQPPGTEFPLNDLTVPVDVLRSGETLPLGPGSGLSLEGYLWNEELHLEFNWDFPEDWKGTFKEDMCNHSCDLNHEGDARCGVHWGRRYAFSEDQLQGNLTVGSFGTLPGDRVDLDLFGIAMGVDLDEYNMDCCAGLHIFMRGFVGEDGRIVLEEYCPDPKGGCDFSSSVDLNIPLLFHCAGSFGTEEERIDACWDEAGGIDPWE
jgi:hypothetical protein